MNLIEKATASVAATTELSFQDQFLGPFLLHTKPPKENSELDASFDTSVRLVPSKASATGKFVLPGHAQLSRMPTSITSLAELQQYYFLYSLEKSLRNTFTQGITIGRTNNNDVPLSDGTVSKFHAWIQRAASGSDWKVFDAQSHYGTYVNNVAAASAGTILRSGDVVRFGGAATIFMTSLDFYRWVKEKRYQFLK
jgi:hypothetical protein